MRFKWKVAIAFGIAAVTLVAVGALSYRHMVSTEQDEKWVAHTYSVREELQALDGDLMAAEKAQRGYLFTGDKNYLPSYREALANVRHDVEEARSLTTADPAPQIGLHKLEPLIAAHLADLQRAIDVHHSSPQARAAAAERSAIKWGRPCVCSSWKIRPKTPS
ncbi:MAG TPA: CHASE3 domain-containing protein [Candidatus Acidoferrales bacterium]|nr:CHASE3 domain-containing protein [Candidatus Acidoferrales bacterium]